MPELMQPEVAQPVTAQPPAPKPRVQLLGNETAVGQLANLASQDNPLNKFARTTATQLMTRRGLKDSSIHTGESVKQMLLASEPAALQDAGALQTQRQTLLAGDVQGGLNREQFASTEGIAARGLTSQEGMLKSQLASTEGIAARGVTSQEKMQTERLGSNEKINAANIISNELISGNQITSVEGIEAARIISNEIISGNQITSVEGIEAARILSNELISGNQITSVEGIEAARILSNELISGNQITSQEGMQTERLGSAETINAANIVSNELISGNQITSVEGIEAARILSNELISGNQITSTEAMDAAGIVSNELISGNQITSVEGIEAARLLSNEFISGEQIESAVSEGALDRTARKELNDAAISGDKDRLTTQLEANKLQWEADFQNRLDVTDRQLDSDTMRAASNAVTAYGTTYMQEVANIQRDPNILERNKAGLIQSATNAYNASLATLASIYGASITFDPIVAFDAGGEGEDIYVPPDPIGGLKEQYPEGIPEDYGSNVMAGYGP